MRRAKENPGLRLQSGILAGEGLRRCAFEIVTWLW